MITLSLCMIVKNESDVLARCLECIKDIADEIIIVDTGSDDNTKEIAERFTPNVFDFVWCEDFSAARNFSFSKATMEYTMWLDADDVIEEADRRLLLELKANLPAQTDTVMMKYDVAFDENGTPTLSYFRERIFRTSMHYQWIGEIHEVIPARGKTEYKEICIKHKKLHPTEKGRNLRIFKKMLADGKTMDPRQKYYFARELMYNEEYVQAIQQFTEFLSEKKGWVENNISACKDLAFCYYTQGDSEKALQSLFSSFCYDVPRAELCCDIGKHFLESGQYRTAIFWYQIASNCEMNDRNGGFCLSDCYGFIPYIQLCVCHDKLGEYQTAMAYNELAGRLKPYNQSYLFNKEYFKKLNSNSN